MASRWRTVLSSVLAALLLVLSTLIGFAPSPAEAQAGSRTIQITGRGWGHGRGLGQYGAYGYATDHGWSSARILNHFYGGTTAGQAPLSAGPVDPRAVRVDLRFMRGVSTAVALDQGNIVVRGVDDVDITRIATGAIRLRWVGDRYAIDTATSCNGPWAAHSTITRTTVRLLPETDAAGSQGLLQACGPSHRTWYHGELRAVVEGGSARTVNVLPIDEYLRGVVPREVPASWPAPALEAQAVAARSYALAGDSRQQPYADTCDTTRCQVYVGVYTTLGGPFVGVTKSSTDAAIAATAGVVRLRNGAVARTEFSSSTGGHTAGGAFPAVVDDGDDTSANPNHTWTVTVDLTAFEARYNRGRLLAMEVTGRNGLGADGGRVTNVRLRFEGGTVNETGNAVRSALGLKSDWFTPGPVVDTAKRSAPAGAYIDRTYQRLVGRTASDGEIERWFTPVQQGNRLWLTASIVRSDHFITLILNDLYQRALGRPADAVGRAYWIDQIQRGLQVQAVGVLFYGSPEYFARSGGTNASFVDALYRAILGREPDAVGKRYWEGKLNDRTANPDDVAYGFYQSIESRRTRAATIHVQARGVATSNAGIEVLADRLLRVDELVLAAEIAASPEA